MLLFAHTPYHQKQRRKQKDKYTPIKYIVIKKTLTQTGFQYSVVLGALAPNLLSLKCCSYFQESDTLQRAGFFLGQVYLLS